ncbi:hypothetical protein PFISCL1PPCAC_24137, partial [Pristionchus fissidentatus]
SVSSVIVRINEVGMQEAANFTRQWLQQSMPKRKLPDVKQAFRSSWASGSIHVYNTTIDRFVPPLIRIRSSSERKLYMNTLSGFAQITSEWLVDSSLFKLVRIPVAGQIQTQMTGLISEIGLTFDDNNELEMADCVALIRDLRVQLKGSVAADLLHWFRNAITRTIRKKIEHQYCVMMRKQWLPWVQAQLKNFPMNLTISRKPEVHLVQSLNRIDMSPLGIDAHMRSDLLWEQEFVQSSDPTNITDIDLDSLPSSTRMVDMLVDEHTVQSVVAAAHFAGHLTTTIQSPFLRTNCEVLCVGTVLPELQEALPNRTLKVQASTLSPPVVLLESGRSLVYMNATLEVFPDPPLPGVKGSILRITVDTDFILTMQMRNNKVKGYLNMIKAQAVVIDSKIGLMSQKLVNMSTPFLEDAVDLFLGRGLFVEDPFQFPSVNEQLSIHKGALRSFMVSSRMSHDGIPPFESIPFICEYLTTREIERTRAVCTTLRDYIDASLIVLPKKIEQCTLRIEEDTAQLTFRVCGGYNDRKDEITNGIFYLSCIEAFISTIQVSRYYYATLERAYDKDFWNSFSDGFSMARIDEITVVM